MPARRFAFPLFTAAVLTSAFLLVIAAGRLITPQETLSLNAAKCCAGWNARAPHSRARSRLSRVAREWPCGMTHESSSTTTTKSAESNLTTMWRFVLGGHRSFVGRHYAAGTKLAVERELFRSSNSRRSPDAAGLWADHRLACAAPEGLLKFGHVRQRPIDTILAR
jgi:hypothetical protein